MGSSIFPPHMQKGIDRLNAVLEESHKKTLAEWQARNAERDRKEQEEYKRDPEGYMRRLDAFMAQQIDAEVWEYYKGKIRYKRKPGETKPGRVVRSAAQKPCGSDDEFPSGVMSSYTVIHHTGTVKDSPKSTLDPPPKKTSRKRKPSV